MEKREDFLSCLEAKSKNYDELKILYILFFLTCSYHLVELGLVSPFLELLLIFASRFHAVELSLQHKAQHYLLLQTPLFALGSHEDGS